MAGVVDSSGALQGIVHAPTPELIGVIVRAWQDPEFRNTLLSYPDDASWEEGAPPDYEKTNSAFGVVGLNYPNPVVITASQYRLGYKKAKDSDTIFVLPDPPNENSKFSDEEAEAQMIGHVFGM